MVSNSIHTIVRARNLALIGHFNADAAPPTVATRDLGELSLTQTYRGGTVEPLDERGSGKIWRFPAADDSSLWVAARSGSYRRHFKTFIGKLYRDVDWDGFDLYDVDHLFNRARSFDGTTLLRVEAVTRKVNQHHGSTFEKSNTHSSIERGNARDMRKLTFVSVLKLAGINAPASDADKKGLQTVRDFFAAQGWEPAEVDLALADLLAKARHRG